MDDWNLDEIYAEFLLQGMTNIVRFTFSGWYIFTIEQDK